MSFIRLRRSVKAVGVFLIVIWDLNTIGKHCKTLERLAAPNIIVQKLDSEVSRLRKANTVATSLRRIVARIQGESADARAQGYHN